MPRRLLALLTVAAFAVAACGGSADTQTEPEPEAQDAPPGDAPADGEIAVKALDFSFSPDEIAVEPGSDVTVQVTNAGSVAHTFTVDDANVDVTVEAGAMGLGAFQAPGQDATLGFVCRFHPEQMSGTIVVGAGGGDAGAGGGSEDDSGAESDYDY